MAKVRVVTPENLGDNFKHEGEKVKVNIDNESIIEDENGILKVNPVGNTRSYSFASPSLQWTIVHDLGKIPSSILLFNNSNKLITAEVTVVDDTTILINFGSQSPMAGYCIISL